MITQRERAVDFGNLHVKGSPLILFNIWDAGSAKVLQENGAKAIATGSWSVAAAHGYPDGEKLPLDLVIQNAERIASVVDLPVTIDFETGYGKKTDDVQQSSARLISTGVVGINFEDQVMGETGLYSIQDQAARIRAVRQTADRSSIPLFINARTDVFLKANQADHNQTHLDEAIRRSDAYAEAGASGFFAPGLRSIPYIESLCKSSSLPVNILMFPEMCSNQQLAELGVARISYGPFPYRQMMAALKEAAAKAMM